MIITHWQDVGASRKEERDNTWPEFVDWLRTVPPLAVKNECPLIKLATFGDKRSRKGSLRTNDNMLTITGIEGDYDDKEMMPEEACAALENANVRGVIVTTHSHKPDAPRWRVLVPLSEAMLASERDRLIRRLNAVFGGKLANESATRSQSYFVGAALGGEYKVMPAFDDPEDGECIDELDELDALISEDEGGSGDAPAGDFDSVSVIDLADAIRSGDAYHESLVRLSAKRASAGMNEAAINSELRALMDASEGPRDERWESRRNDVERITRSAVEKFYREPVSPEAIEALSQSLRSTRPDAGWRIKPFDAEGTPDLSHDRLALDMSKAGFGRNARYVHAWGKWLFWDQSRWSVDERLIHLTLTREFLRVKADELIKWGERGAAKCEDTKAADKLVKWARENAKAIRQAPSVNSVESMARSNSDLVATADQFDTDLDLIGTPGGTVDLRTGELVEPERNHWITQHCAVTPAAPGTPAPQWHKFLDRVLDGDDELIRFVQRAAGYALTGHTVEHKLLFFYGTGRNGKSVFLNTLFAILGDYAKRAAAQTFLDSSTERHPTDLAGLQGARLVAGSELSPGKAWNESVVKDLTGGDVITARYMRQDFFDFKPQFTLFIAGNHQPSFRGIDEAIRARVVLVPFTQTIPKDERDPDLPGKLRDEWPAILRWMIEGATEWRRHGLDVPESVQAASDEYLDSEDMLGEFIEENVVQNGNPDAKVTVAAMYERFKQWQTQSGISQPWQKRAMTRALRERGYKTSRLSGNVAGYRGLSLASFEYCEVF